MNAYVCKNCGKVMAEAIALDDKGNFALELGRSEQIRTDNGDKVFVCPHCGAEHPLISERSEGGAPRLRLLPSSDVFHYKDHRFQVKPFQLQSGNWVLKVLGEEHGGKWVRVTTFETPEITAGTENEAIRLGLFHVHAWIDRKG